MAAHILPFVSRIQLLMRRGARNYGRWMMKVKNHVEPGSAECRQWEEEAFAEKKADADWTKRHGPVAEGATVARFRRGNEWPEPTRTDHRTRPCTEVTRLSLIRLVSVSPPESPTQAEPDARVIGATAMAV